MSQKKNKARQPQAEVKSSPTPIPVPVAEQPKEPLSLSSFRVQAAILAILGFVFYFNTFNNDYALDDGIIIAKNQYVQQGFKGIPNIMGKDAFDSYYSSLNATNQLSGGRYRPLSIVTFAVEQELFGSGIDYSKVAVAYGVISPDESGFIHLMHIRHVVNVLLYILASIVLLYFLTHIAFPQQPLVGFLAALLFVIHPIHTEVVANVKSRDEIMSLLFICLTFISAYRYAETKKIISLAFGLLWFFLALLSKEYAVILLAMLPLMFYLFRGDTLPKSIIRTLPYIAVFAVYFYLRFSIIADKSESSDEEVLNNPYLYATGAQRIASEIAVLFRYLSLLFFPHPLSSDYSYKQIPYSELSDPIVWLSIAIHIGMVAAMFILFKKRHVLCFALAFYLLNLLLVSNFIFDIGAPLGERLIFHSSVGFVMIIAWLLYEAYKKTPSPEAAKVWMGGLLLLLIIASGYKTMSRNIDWKNDHNLFLADVKTAPNSVVTNANAGACYIGMADQAADTVLKREYLDTALIYLNKTLKLHPTFSNGYLNRGVVYFKLGNIQHARSDFDSLKKIFPHYPTLPTLYGLIGNYYLNIGWNQYGKLGHYAEAIPIFNQGLDADPTNAELWYNVGGAQYSLGNYEAAYTAWIACLKYNPNHKQAQAGLASVRAILHK